MNTTRLQIRLALLASTAVLATLGGAPVVRAAPVKLIPAGQFGREVNLTEVQAHAGLALENTCTVASGDVCQLATPGSAPGEFQNAQGTAGAPNGNVYVADNENERVQEITPAGGFVLMFGKDVNQTTGGNICTQQEIQMSGVKCKAGTEGEGAGAFREPSAVAVDPSTGNVYVLDVGATGERVDEYTGGGQFVLRIGREVNATRDSAPGATVAEKNLCTAASGDTCQGAASSEPGTTEPGAIKGSLVLAAGGPENLLYIGGEHRVQEFEANGGYKLEIPLTSFLSGREDLVSALAVSAAGEVYLVYEGVSGGHNVIHRFNPGGEETGLLTLGAAVGVFPRSIAIDSAGRLAVVEREEVPGGGGERTFGVLYQAETFRPITEFVVRPQPFGDTFTPSGELFMVLPQRNGISSYAPVPVAELVGSPVVCVAGGEQETDVTLSCALKGEVNPEGVSETEVWFGWGRTPGLGSTTPVQPVASGEALVPVSAQVEGLRPGETFYYRLEGHDHNVKAPEALGGETGSFSTPVVAPRVVGEPAVSFVGSSSAVFSGVLNPENTGTRYRFQYGACATLDACPGLGATGSLESAVYGKVPTTLEASGLQPATVYHYRLTAEGSGGVAQGAEGQFTTAPAPVVGAQTGSVSGVGVGSAVISGAVSPAGQPAVYAFELGVDSGLGTQFGVVFSGQVPGSTVPVAESLALSGLQPGVRYAYRIVVRSGYGTATGEAVTFTTQGLPAVLSSPVAPALLAVPAVAFPKIESAPRVKAKPKHTKKTKKRKQTKKRKKRSAKH